MSILSILFFVTFYAAVALAFQSAPASSRTQLRLYMGTAPKPSGFPSTKEGKTIIIERTKALLAKSEMVITIPGQGITKENIDILKKGLGKTVTASCVKNSLMGIAAKGTAFEAISTNGDGLGYQNIFLFIPEGEAKPAYKAYAAWRKEIKRQEVEYDAKNAVMDNVFYTGKDIAMVTSLPTKLELITKIAQGIKMVPTKVGLGIKAVPRKLGRAFGALKDKLEDEANPSPVAEAVADATTVE